MKTLLFACGLLMTGGAWAATISGSIDVRLTIYKQCEIDGQTSARHQTAVSCGRQPSAQPKVTSTPLQQDVGIDQKRRLITVEW